MYILIALFKKKSTPAYVCW